MRLYIAEKKSVGRTLSAVLPGDKTRDNNFIRCGDDIVTWASGHLLELYEPQDYDSSFASWRFEDLPIVPETWKLKEIARTRGLLDTIRGLLEKSSEVIHAGDSDREGQLLIDEILEYCGWKGKTLRLRINDVNPDAIRKALKGIKDNTYYIGEYRAGQARSYADWLVGMNLSRFCTLSAKKSGYEVLFSVGRVQTPTLGLVVKRDRDIENFTPKQYYVVFALLQLPTENRQIIGRWQPRDDAPLDEEKRLVDPDFCKELEAKLQGVYGTITKVDKKILKKPPPLLYNLSKLQIDAAKKHDITDTLEHAQKLYENGYITYPRSGCQYMPENHRHEAGRIIDAIRIVSPAVMQDIARNADISRKSTAWDDSKVTEHHAIIPTFRVPLPEVLSENEQKIYDLICIRYLLQFLPEYEYEQTVVEFIASDELFRATGRYVLNPGWMGWDIIDDDTKGNEEGNDSSSTIPHVVVGETGNAAPITEEKTTTPPKRFTYDSLLAAMNGIYAFVEDKDIRNQLKEIDGIGTPATQENIIKLLFDRKFLEKQKKQIISTPLGRGLVDILNSETAAELVKPDITAIWEQSMSKIEAGELELKVFLSEVSSFVRSIVSSPLNIVEILGVNKLKNCLNAECNGYLKHFEKEKNRFFVCPVCNTIYNDRNGEPLKRIKTEGEIIEADCPLGCGRKARQFSGQYGKFWRCFCSETIFKDVDGHPVVNVKIERPKAKCPFKGCKGKAEQIPRKDGGKFWKCNICGNTFSDDNDKPVVKSQKKEHKK